MWVASEITVSASLQVKSNRSRASFHAAFRALVEARFVVRPVACIARTR